MTKLFTASWSTLHQAVPVPAWAPLEVLPVRISRDTPAFWPRAQSFPAIEDLMPDRWTLSMDLDRFSRAYRRKLDEVGIERVQAQLDQLADSYDRPLALAGFEADPADCHRGPVFGFACWYEGQTGIPVPEWEPTDHGMAKARPLLASLHSA
jgi:hypothetical protein